MQRVRAESELTASAGSAPRPLGRAARLAAVIATLGAAVVLGIPLCPFAIATGFPCPGCGMTRATLALAQGHIDDALRFHPLSPVIAPVAIGAFAYGAVVYLREGRFIGGSIRPRWAFWLCMLFWAAVVLVWLARFFGAFGGPVSV